MHTNKESMSINHQNLMLGMIDEELELGNYMYLYQYTLSKVAYILQDIEVKWQLDNYIYMERSMRF